MLQKSRLYSFLDHKNGFNLHFLEGQKLIHDLVLNHPMKSSGFSYFRDTFLGLMPIIFFLKPQESLGIYIDSDSPYFRLKIETNSAGHTRTLLLPEEFNTFPMKLTGQVRVTKMTRDGHPYTSIIKLEDTETKEVINKILKESYQTNSEVIVGELSDQSIMVNHLPPLNVNKIDSLSDESYVQQRKNFIKQHSSFFHHVFETASNDIEQIVQMFEQQGFSYTTSRQIEFFCPCSTERMLKNLQNLYHDNFKSLFQNEQGEVMKEIEVKCDYCGKKYHFVEKDFLS